MFSCADDQHPSSVHPLLDALQCRVRQKAGIVIIDHQKCQKIQRSHQIVLVKLHQIDRILHPAIIHDAFPTHIQIGERSVRITQDPQRNRIRTVQQKALKPLFCSHTPLFIQKGHFHRLAPVLHAIDRYTDRKLLRAALRERDHSVIDTV